MPLTELEVPGIGGKIFPAGASAASCSTASVNKELARLADLAQLLPEPSMFQTPSAQATFFGADDLLVHQQSKQMFLTCTTRRAAAVAPRPIGAWCVYSKSTCMMMGHC